MRSVGHILFVYALNLAFFVSAFAAKPPNIIIVYVDDMGYGDASCLNPKSKFKTPNIDRLAKEGMTFTDGHCSDTVCTPSRYGLLTGRYSWRTTLKRGVMKAEAPCLIADGRVTLASFLRENGYATAMVGKWHLGMDFPGTWGKRDWTQPVRDMPLDKGFDYYWGIPASMNYGVLAWFEGRFAKVPPTQYTAKKPNKVAISDYRIKPPYAKKPPDNRKPQDLEVAPDFVDIECLDRFTTQSIKWLDGRAKAARKGKPFFLYLPYTSPHKPVIPMAQFHGQGNAGAYGEFMVETDWHLGRILNWLDNEKLVKNTMVIFTSDNGPWGWANVDGGSSGLLKGNKGSVYEGGYRVPAIAWMPGRIPKGVASNVLASTLDFFPTIVSMAGGTYEKQYLDGLNITKTILNNISIRSDIHYYRQDTLIALRHKEWKIYIKDPNPWDDELTQKDMPALYNMEHDPSEKYNIAKENSEVVKKLKSLSEEHIRSVTKSPSQYDLILPSYKSAYDDYNKNL